MQQNSFFLGCNYSNSDSTSWSLCPVQEDIDTLLTNRYGVNVDDTFSLLYCDLYLRQVKETLKHTMLVHESVFESQIHELHRLYRKQKELMMELEGTRHHQLMSSSISSCQFRSCPHEEGICNQMEARLLVDNKAEKSENKVLDLEDFLREKSLRSISLESGKQSSKMELDLNEPAKVEEHSDYVFNQLLSSVTSNVIGEEFSLQHEGEDSVKASHGINEGQGSLKCLGEYGIDLNMSPISTGAEVSKFETEKTQESLSVSLRENHRSEESRMVVQVLPCSTSILLLDKRDKPLMKGSRPRKKVKLGPSNDDSDLDPHLNGLATSESQSNQASKEKESSSSLSKVKSARNLTNLGKKRRRKPQMKSSKVHKVSGRIKRKKTRRVSLVTEGNLQERSAAEIIVDMSRKCSGEISDCITSLGRNLLWFAEISCSVTEDCEIDYSEAMTLQMTEIKLDKSKANLRLNSSDNKTVVSNFVHGRQRRSRSLTYNAYQHSDNPTLLEVNEDLQVKLIEASESKGDHRILKNKIKISLPKPIDAFTFFVKAIRKRRRGSRIPATDFQHMIINQSSIARLKRELQYLS